MASSGTLDVEALNRQYQSEMMSGRRCVAWEGAVRLWRVRRQVKKHRAAAVAKDPEAARVALGQYGRAVEEVARLMQIDPLKTKAAKDDSTNATRTFVTRDSEKTYKWRDVDSVGPAVALPADGDASNLSEGAPLETSGDRRKKAIAERKQRSQMQADARLARRKEDLAALTAASTGVDADGDAKPAAQPIEHNWDGYRSELDRQKAAVKMQTQKLEALAGDKDRFADILSDSD